MNENKHNGPYMPKEKIAFWFPVSREYAEQVEVIRSAYRRRGKRPLAPYQTIELAIQKLRKSSAFEK